MNHRTDRIPLDPSEPRCVPNLRCVVREQCARYCASIPARGATIIDYVTTTPRGGTALCPGYVNADYLRRQVADAPARKVHPPVRGL